MIARRRFRLLALSGSLLALEALLLVSASGPGAALRAAELQPGAATGAVSLSDDTAPHTVPSLSTPVPSATPTPTPTAAPTPAPASTPRPTPAPVRAAPASGRPASTPAPAPAQRITNRLIGSGIDAGVTTYSDCSGQAPVPRTLVAIDTCDTRILYFLGHNPGLFTPLFGATAGTRLTYYDGSGTPHVYTIEGHWDIKRAGATFPAPPAGVVAEFQTCVDPSATMVRIFYAS